MGTKTQSEHWVEYMNKDIMRAIMKIIIMSKIKNNKEMYAYAILKEVKKIKHPVVRNNSQIKNVVYNTLKALQQAGYIKKRDKIEGKHIKTYYSLTSNGIKTLNKTKQLIKATAKSMVKIVG